MGPPESTPFTSRFFSPCSSTFPHMHLFINRQPSKRYSMAGVTLLLRSQCWRTEFWVAELPLEFSLFFWLGNRRNLLLRSGTLSQFFFWNTISHQGGLLPYVFSPCCQSTDTSWGILFKRPTVRPTVCVLNNWVESGMLLENPDSSSFPREKRSKFRAAPVEEQVMTFCLEADLH